MKKTLKWLARSLGYEIRAIAPPPRHVMFDATPDRDYELLKAFATRAAQFSKSSGETQAVRSLYLSGVLQRQPQPEDSRIEVGGTHTKQVGLWKRTGEGKDAAFLRSRDRQSEWSEWADKERIGPKRAKWRVVLLGESVARGYLYDPDLSPASALEAMLGSHLPAGEIEVVDLAKINLTLEPLRALVGRCLALRPDVIVVFAGNNWRAQIAEPDVPYVYGLLLQEGVPGMKSYLDARRVEAARQFISQVNSIVLPRDVKLVWVVPEFNLGDWVDPAANAPLLVGRGNKEWRDLSARADLALRERDRASAESIAQRMTALDQGTSSVPLRILAECRRTQGDLQETRRYLEMCRDAEGWDPSFPYSPRAPSAIQDALRQAASAPQTVVVDLPDIFSRHLDHGLPDRRMFLDYCHLTADGISVAMAAVASGVLKLLTGQLVQPGDLRHGSPAPAPKVEGKASLLAAVHNAHFYQSYDVVHHWCLRALKFWPECAPVMTRILDFQTRHVPIMACKSALELYERLEAGALRYVLRLKDQRLDLVLSKASVDSVRTIGIDVEKEVSDRCSEEHSLKTGPKELTSFCYSSAIVGPSERAWTSRSFPTNRGSHATYASAFWDQSRFVFFGEKGRPVGLKFTYRVPDSCAPDGSVAIDLNGRRVARAPAGRTWQTLDMSILGDCAIDGLNEIVITWPDVSESSDNALRDAANLLIARRLPRFYSVFGEIHALLVFEPSDRESLRNLRYTPSPS